MTLRPAIIIGKFSSLTSWQAAAIIAAVGFAVFSTGLANPFMGDDIGQIVDNVPVHSISNIRLFFEGGTFYNGKGLAPLEGAYYRPLMTTVFSVLYAMFGPQPFYFHLFQLVLCIGSAILLYLFFRYSFPAILSLVLSIIFLVHPIDAQVVIAIPAMQDALFFFFGMLALWLLLRFKSVRSLILVASALLLSLFAKETAALFVVMALLYLFFFDRRSLMPFAGIMALPAALFAVLRTQAAGVSVHSNLAPIDNLSLAGRMMTAPSILLHYFSTFIFPWQLASKYYWVNPGFSIWQVLLPLMIDLAVVALAAYGAVVVRRKASEAYFLTYMFFAAWAMIGLLLHLQIIPLDFTVTDPWFYFPMAGILGMMGVAAVSTKQIMPFRLSLGALAAVVVAGIVLLGVRTAFFGFIWKDAISVAQNDISVSSDEYNAYFQLANYNLTRGDYHKAAMYAAKSVSIFPTPTNTNTLGASLVMLGDYGKAYSAFNRSLRYGILFSTVENLARLTPLYGSSRDNEQFFLKSASLFPQDTDIWFFWAIQLYRDGYYPDARLAINRAAQLGAVQSPVYDGIINHHSFEVKTPSATVGVQ